MNSNFFSFSTKVRLVRSLLTKNQPIYVQYYVTARCNLACEQCNIIYSNADVRECTLSEVEQIARNLAEIGVGVVLLTGGEPFVRRDLPQIVSAFVKQGIHVRLQTNGLASKDDLEKCVAAGANDISISLDSLEPATQDLINGDFTNSWQKAIRTVSYVNELFREDSFAAFGCVLAPRNLTHVPDLIRFATEIGWFISLVPAHTTRRNQPLNFRTYDENLQFPKESFALVDSVLNRIMKMKGSGYNVYDSTPYLRDIKRMIFNESIQWRDRNGGICDSPNLYFAILPNGSMAVCCDWRMKSYISVHAKNFPSTYRNFQTYQEAQTIAASCPGCMYGSFPEITVSARFLKSMIYRSIFFGKPSQTRKLKKLTEAELFDLAKTIRAGSEYPNSKQPSPGKLLLATP